MVGRDLTQSTSVSTGETVPQIAGIIGASIRTVRRRMTEYDFSVHAVDRSATRWNCEGYSNLISHVVINKCNLLARGMIVFSSNHFALPASRCSYTAQYNGAIASGQRVTVAC